MNADSHPPALRGVVEEIEAAYQAASGGEWIERPKGSNDIRQKSSSYMIASFHNNFAPRNVALVLALRRHWPALRAALERVETADDGKRSSDLIVRTLWKALGDDAAMRALGLDPARAARSKVEIKAGKFVGIEGLRHALSQPQPQPGAWPISTTPDTERCNDCGSIYDAVYRLDDATWAKIHENAPAGLLCPPCAQRRAAARGISLWWEACPEHYPTAQPQPGAAGGYERKVPEDFLRELEGTAALTDDGKPSAVSLADVHDIVADLRSAESALSAATARIAEVERERDLAVAHDRQPYPTVWAYEKACEVRNAAIARAESAERELDALREALAKAERNLATVEATIDFVARGWVSLSRGPSGDVHATITPAGLAEGRPQLAEWEAEAADPSPRAPNEDAAGASGAGEEK